MKLTKEEMARLKALIAMGATISADDQKELDGLKTKAVTADYKYDEATGEAIEDDEGGLTTEEVKTLVATGLGDALTGIGLDAETVKSLKETIEGQAGAVTPDGLKSAIKDAIGGQGLDAKAVEALIKKSIPTESLTEAGVKTLLDTFKKDIVESTRRASKTVFEDAHAPIEHREGNLTVGQKQLLNLTLMNAPESALENSDGGHGITRPKSMNDGITEDQLRSAVVSGARYAKSIRQQMLYGGKTLTTGGSGTGAELMNTDLSSELLTRLYLNSELASQLITSEINMPSNPFKFPLSTTRTPFRKGAEGVAPVAGNAGTGGLTLDAEKLIGIAEYSYEADEDAIIAILPFLQETMGLGASASLEDALINGDTTATHMDSDTHAVGATAPQRLFKGFRKYAVAGSIISSFATGGISAANIGALRKLMLKYGIRPKDLMLVAGVQGYNDIVLLDETLTQDKVGANARILTGTAPEIFGIPIITSEAVREDLNASGVYDGVTTDKGSMLLVHKPSFIMGVRRGFTVETDVDKSAQVNKVIASFRRAFMPMETPSTALPMVALGYNYES